MLVCTSTAWKEAKQSHCLRNTLGKTATWYKKKSLVTSQFLVKPRPACWTAANQESARVCANNAGGKVQFKGLSLILVKYRGYSTKLHGGKNEEIRRMRPKPRRRRVQVFTKSVQKQWCGARCGYNRSRNAEWWYMGSGRGTSWRTNTRLSDKFATHWTFHPYQII